MLPKECLSKDGYIINQTKMQSVVRGDFKTSYNGCGWIAVYNLLKLIGKPMHYKKVIDTIGAELPLDGLFGTSAVRVVRALKKLGVYACSHLNKPGMVGIILYAHKRGCHYIAYERMADGRLHLYNDIQGKEDDIITWEEFRKKRALLGTALCINVSR